MTKNRQLLVVTLVCISLVLLLYWLIWGNKGKIIVHLPVPYTLSAEGFAQFQCAETPCVHQIPFGVRNFCILKEGFQLLCDEQNIPWRGETDWNPVLVSLPTVIPASDSISVELPFSQEVQRKQGDFTYDNDTGFLSLVHADGSHKRLTRFYGIRNPEIIPFYKNVFLRWKNEVFFIDVEKRQKKRILRQSEEEDPVHIHILSPDTAAFVYTTTSSLFHQGELTKLPFHTSASHMVMCDDSLILYAEQSEEDVSFFRYALSSRVTSFVISAESSLDFSLSCGATDQEIYIEYADRDNEIIRL